MPPYGHSKHEEFDLTVHLQLELDYVDREEVEHFEALS